MASASRGLDFARGILEKYGWKEGQGLGRDNTGIVKALRPVMKFDSAGIGHTGISDEFTSRWWEHAYNKVAKNIIVTNEENVQVTQKNKPDLLKCKRTRPPVATYDNRDYQSFLKKSVLTNEGLVNMSESKSGIFEDDEVAFSTIQHISDEEIFRACGGRTVHKGARHGLKLNGKLARIQRQEEELMKRLQSPKQNICETRLCTVVTTKAKKKDDTKELKRENATSSEKKAICGSDPEDDGAIYLSKKHKKSRKNKEVEDSSITSAVIITDLPLPPEVCARDITKRKKRKQESEENQVFSGNDFSLSTDKFQGTPKERKKDCSSKMKTKKEKDRKYGHQEIVEQTEQAESLVLCSEPDGSKTAKMRSKKKHKKAKHDQ